MLEKLGGLAVIAVATAALCLISVLNPPTFIQIFCAFVGAIIYLIGVVILFSEGPILTSTRRVKTETAPEASRTLRETAS
jgi:hypothetical protein